MFAKNISLGDCMKENFEGLFWKIENYSEEVYFVWTAYNMLGRVEAAVVRRRSVQNFKEKKKVLKKKIFVAKKKLEDLEGKKEKRVQVKIRSTWKRINKCGE